MNVASKPGSLEWAGREGKESLVHTDCACIKLYQDLILVHRLFSVYFFSKLLAKRLLAKRLWREISSWVRLQKVKASPPV